jgi:hypothetical protein
MSQQKDKRLTSSMNQAVQSVAQILHFDSDTMVEAMVNL